MLSECGSYGGVAFNSLLCILLDYAEEREWIDGFLNKYVDLYRHFHPNETDVFSVWNQKTEARIHNEGLRLVFFSFLNSKHFASLCIQSFFSLHLEHHFISERCQKLNSDVC
jgi:hypothetical protein